MSNNFLSDQDKQEWLDLMRVIWVRIDEIWTVRNARPAFSGYVSADYEEVFEQLWRMRKQAGTFLEWGSGLGAVAMMAAVIGYEAYGIEAEEELVRISEDLADEFDIDVTFATGSFIPDDFAWEPATGANVTITQIDIPDAYAELGMELSDFDMVYAYPWPDEHGLLEGIMKQFSRPGTTLFTFDAHEGNQLRRF